MHVRVQCFGDHFYSAYIRSPDLDWRLRLDRAAIERYELCREVEGQLLQIMTSLKLRMGIFDLKITPAGEIVWLEVNQQGRCVFIEGLADIKLTGLFAAFLIDEAGQARTDA